MKKTLLASLVLVCFHVGVCAQAAEVPEGVHLDSRQHLVRGNGAEPSSLDPQLAQDLPGHHILVDLFEGLVGQDAAGNVVPAGSTHWDVTTQKQENAQKDRQIYTFHLRRDAQWSDGKPVTARDYVFGFRRAVDPELASPYGWYIAMPGVLNAKAIMAGKEPPAALGVKALDDYTFQVTLEQPVSFFVRMLAYPTTFPVPAHIVEKYGKQWISPGKMVSNGAYVLKEWVVNEQITVARNTRYWNDKKTVINKVTWLPLTSETAELNRYKAGEVDMTNHTPGPQHIRALRKEIPDEIRISPQIGTYYYTFNTRKEHFNDVRVRKALTYAIDREAIATRVMNHGERPAIGLSPTSVAGFSGFEPEWVRMTQSEREQKARELLKEAGYGSGTKKKLSFTLLYNTDDMHKNVALAVAQMWKKVLGVEVRLQNQEWKVFLDNMQKGRFDVGRSGWLGDYNEAFTMLNLMTSSNDSNYSRFSNDEYDQLLEQAMLEVDDSKRKKIYGQAERILSEYMPVAPIYEYVTGRLVKSHVGGYPDQNPQDTVYSKDLYIKKHS
ncbi:MAG: peptide ABC transporter substrate-binding protein [Kistimonas sp.]|nr:peptide ABC transporter substrate-binding protein [Kistimonas sp.]